MPFDQPTRNALAKMVGDCRRLLTEDIRKQLQGTYGLQPDGTALLLDALAHLNERGREIAGELREWQDHLAANEVGSETKRRAAAFERITRETAFTVLNRLAALRLCEERGHVIECVRRGMASDGFQLFERLAGGALGTRGETYRIFLDRTFDELALDLGVLFDPRDPRSLVFPDEQCLEQVLALFTAPALSPLWQEDETIGWIYQYFNDPAERKKMRESAAPRNSYELSVRNQFFTPRYVVEFLTDNTLGRIWYEMTRGETKLKEQCRYLVRRPNEIFLKPGETAPEQQKQDNISQEDVLTEPVHILHRPLKDPRAILMLDPACGSMHFGLYAFDLFEVIYTEWWDHFATKDQKAGVIADCQKAESIPVQEIVGIEEQRTCFLRQVPRLIIEHNLHGIDIDPRCAQIAGLSLWLRAQKSWKRLGFKPAERPVIKHSNVVCAEPMPGKKDLLPEFVEREFPSAERALFLRFLEAIFDKMQLAGEAGSLLKIEDDIRSAIAESKKLWKEGPKPGQTWLFPEAAPAEPKQMKLDLSGITDEQFWERAEERIYAALRDYAEQTENGGGFQRRLFAEDAARGFAFIDVCRKRYDVVVMNPPFGETSDRVTQILLDTVSIAKKNTYIASIVIGEHRLTDGGTLAAITDGSFIHQTRYEEFRNFLLNQTTRNLSCLTANGWGVLESYVETASFVLAPRSDDAALFIDLREHGDFRADTLLSSIKAFASALQSNDHRYLRISAFRRMPKSVLAFWLPAPILEAYRNLPSLTPLFVDARCGLSSSDNPRFYKLRWEVDPGEISRQRKWVFLSNGGSPAPLFRQQVYIVNYERDGREIKARVKDLFGSETRTVINQQYYFRPGFTYGKRTESLTVQLLPEGHVFSNEGQAIFPTDLKSAWIVLAYLNTSLVAFLLNSIAGQHKEAGYVGSLPAPPPAFLTEWIEHSTRANYALLARHARSIPEAQSFVWPFIGVDTSSNEVFKAAAESVARENDAFSNTFVRVDEFLESALGFHNGEPLPWSHRTWDIGSILYDITTKDIQEVITQDCLGYVVGITFGRWDVRYATGENAVPELPEPFAPLPVCPPGMLQNARGLPVGPKDMPNSYPIGIPWDGILVDDSDHPLDVERRVREVIELIWEDGAEAVEQQACELLGVKTLREYVRKPASFFADHLKRYSKSRRQAPIYWPLSTDSGSYSLWIYYHRLTDQTLYACVNDFVQPKLNDLERDIPRLSDEKRTRELQTAVALQSELEDFKQELLTWAPRWKPNLNDGVLITACPLWKLFRLPKWRKDLEACWKELEAGEYDWAHLAYTLWPERVREKCKKDRSLAIAHGLEDICEVEPPKAKRPKKGRRTKDEAAPQMELGSNGEAEDSDA